MDAHNRGDARLGDRLKPNGRKPHRAQGQTALLLFKELKYSARVSRLPRHAHADGAPLDPRAGRC